MTGGEIQDGGREFSANGVGMFVQKWNKRNLKWAVECPVRPIPAVVKIPRTRGDEIRVWVKTPGYNAEKIYLSKQRIHGDFLVLVHRASPKTVFYVMNREEVKKQRKRESDGGFDLWVEDFLGRNAWDKLENAVRS